MKKHKLTIAAAAALIAFVSGGCSWFAQPRQMISINLLPPDATITVNGALFQGSPMYYEAYRGNDMLISVQRPEKRTRYFVVGRHLSSTGVLDSIGSVIILPIFGLCAPGAWNFDTRNINIDLDKFEDSLIEAESPDKDATEEHPAVINPDKNR
ncbi:MAG: hypothetical protein PHI35_01625 [Victivallaceae bacterium]|nr:hypothetical protein [Victivallaceae bacterium]